MNLNKVLFDVLYVSSGTVSEQSSQNSERVKTENITSSVWHRVAC